MLLSLALGATMAVVASLAGAPHRVEAALAEKTVFTSNRTTGTGVNNPTGDYEIFTMKPDGMGVKRLTFNETDDGAPTLSSDGTKVAYESEGVQTSNPEGDSEVYVMNALDGTGKKNLSNNGTDAGDYEPAFSPDGTKVAYTSQGRQTSSQEGDFEVYRVNTLDGLGKKNLTNNDLKVRDSAPDFSRYGTRITYISYGIQTTNQEGDHEIYRMNALDGSGQTNLSNNAAVDGAFVKATRG